ncbi:hypothetical protein BHM03_00026752 [Ensete ventricosum]|nr:hypothetical protein BHM03_00026752 [Ensete ventricosum]
MSQECSMVNNLGEDIPSLMQQTPVVALQPPPPLSLLGDGNPTTHTAGHYWRLFNNVGLTLPEPNLRSLMVIPEAFMGLTNQVQAIAGMLRTIIPYIPQLTQQPNHQPEITPLPPQGQHCLPKDNTWWYNLPATLLNFNQNLILHLGATRLGGIRPPLTPRSTVCQIHTLSPLTPLTL